MSYDENNVFSKILKGEIPCELIYEDDFSIAFNDINPQAKKHILLIPKGKYISMDDFSEKASQNELISFFRAIGVVARKFDLDKTGYRILANHGPDSHQEVPHFHVHILGGNSLGPLIAR
tara:strand:- start:4068 stop:4427 length:360 start_codon:yes stop_codon:yes gene_type:complete